MRNPIIEEDLQFIAKASLPWKSFEGKNVLISGANGFLPSYMAETLLFLNETLFKNKLKLFVLVRNKEKAFKRFSNYLGRPELVFIIQDVCEPIDIKEDINFIIHAASQASPKYFGSDPVGTLSSNIFGTKNLLDLARIKKVKSFLFFSSGEVYGEVSGKDVPLKEDNYGVVSPLDVRSCYAESKRIGETMCICWFHQYGVPVKIVRPFHTYGHGMSLDDGRVYADFISDVINDRNIVMKSDGSAVRAFCYIADATIGFFTVLLKGENAEAYNVGNSKGQNSVLNLANLLIELFPEKKLKLVKSKIIKDGYIKSKIVFHVPDITKIKKLGWTPRYSLKKGFARTVRSYLSE